MDSQLHKDFVKSVSGGYDIHYYVFQRQTLPTSNYPLSYLFKFRLFLYIFNIYISLSKYCLC